MKRIDLNIDHLIELYRSGLSCKQIAEQLGVLHGVVRRRLAEVGIRFTGNRSVYDEALALRLYLEGGSVKAVAAQLGIQRNTLTALLRKHGITPRGRSDAMFLRMAQATPEDRQRITEAAHAATRGRPQPKDRCIRMAKGRERTKSHASPDAIAIGEALAVRGFPVTLEKALGTYNLDIAFDERPVAVEIQGGHWHSHGRHGARLAERREYILSGGWHLVEVWRFNDPASLSVEAMADHLIAIAEGLSLDPAGRGEHWVIAGNGKRLAALKSYGYDVPPIYGSEHRCEDSGRYVSVA